MSTVKLQKLVYYAQAWSLVREEDVLFNEEIEAWANGPVIPQLFHAHKGCYRVNAGSFPEADSSNLKKAQRKTVDLVTGFYGIKEPQWLSDLTHAEDPWKEARKGLNEGERGHNVITKESLLNYYSSI